MRITCPNCWTQFHIESEQVPDQGVRLRCSWCGHQFVPEEATVQLESETEQTHRSPEEAKALWEPPPSPANPGKRRRIAVLIGLVLALVAAGTWYWAANEGNLFWGKNSQTPGQKQAQESGKAELSKIVLRDVRQYFVDNEEIGELFVIEGKAVNTFSSPKGLIRLEARLFDAESSVVAEKTFLCGNTVSLFQLQVLSQEKLESALEAKVGVLTKNTSVPPQESVPFMAVFFSPPSSVEEFGLRVVQAKTPPKS
ncbi:MAG: DUF3426 domain-containing protein [Desulfohalobium sp.]